MYCRCRADHAKRAKRLVSDVHANQDKDEAIGKEREILPRIVDPLAPVRGQEAVPADAADRQSGG